MNQRPKSYTFQRYLAAKRTVDDRAINHHVWESLHAELARRVTLDRPLQILELGGGIGTMVERLLEDGRLPEVTYHLLDEQTDNIATAVTRLSDACSVSPAVSAPQLYRSPNHQLRLEASSGATLNLNLYTSDLYDFLSTAGPLSAIDLILAHAFMDLVNIPNTLPLFTASLSPGALLYFTINFDGATILEPAIDPAFDAHIEQVYHRTMDERVIAGKPSGDSRTGRHLFHQMQTAGIQTVDAGSSDWVIIPHHGSYPHDESYFLHFIIYTMHDALLNHPAIDPQRFEAWIAARHAQIERGELLYIAHQLDYLGKFQGTT
jgi:hypothetical protein